MKKIFSLLISLLILLPALAFGQAGQVPAGGNAIAIRGKVVPALSSGYLNYNGTAWVFTSGSSAVAFSAITGAAGDNTSLASALALKAPLASPTFTGTVTMPTGGTGAVPILLVSGALKTSPAAGGLEFLTDALYFTITTGVARKTIAFTDSSLSGNTTGSAAKWTTARALAGNNVDGSAAVAFANKFIVQGTADSGLSGAQFLGALGSGLVYNSATTGVLSIATAGTDYPGLASTNSWTGANTVATGGSFTVSGTGTIKATNLVFSSEAQGDIAVRGATVWGSLAKGTQYYPLVAGATDPSYAQLTATGIANNTITAGKLSTTLTFPATQSIDLDLAVPQDSHDYGIAIPGWANKTPTSDKNWITVDRSANAIKFYNGGWVTVTASGAPTTAKYLVLGYDATLSAEELFTPGVGLTATDAGANSTYTLAVTLNTLVGNQTLWDGSQASRTLTFALSAGSPVLTLGNAVFNVSTGTIQQGGVPVVLSPSGAQVSIAGPTQARVITVNDNAFSILIPASKALTLAGSLTTTGAYDVSFTMPGAYTYTFPGATKTLAANDGSNWTFGSQAAGDIAYANGTTSYTRLAKSSAYTHLMMNSGATAPAWSTATFNDGTTNALTITFGTGNITIGAAGTLGVTAAKAVSFTQNLTVQTGAVTLTGDSSGSTLVFPAGSLTLPTVAQGDIWYGSGTGVIAGLTKSSTAGLYLKNSGTSNNPAWATLDPAVMVITSQAQGDILYASSSTAWARLGQSTQYKFLITNGSAANPSWSAYTTPASIATGDLLYGSNTNVLTALTIGGSGSASVGSILMRNATIPVWSTVTIPQTVAAGSILVANSANALTALTSTSGTYFLQNASGTLSWATGVGTIGGSTGSTDNAIIRADGTGGVTIQSSSVTIDDSGNVTAISYATSASDGSNKITLSNNTTIAPTASTHELYVEANVWKINQNGTEYSVPLSATGNQVSFATAITSGGLLYGSAANAISSSGLLTAHGVVIAQGAATAPAVAINVANPTYPLFANTAADPTFRAIANGDLPVVIASKGGTGVANNDLSTITITGNYGLTVTLAGATALTFPTGAYTYTFPGSTSTLAILGANTFTGLQQHATTSNEYFYNTADMVTNYDRFFMKFASNVFEIGTEVGGSGTLRQIHIKSTALSLESADIMYLTAGTTINSSGDFILTSGNAFKTVADGTSTLKIQGYKTAATAGYIDLLTVTNSTGAAPSLTLAYTTLTTPVISTGLTASGSAANNFSGSTGTFLTSTGAVTIGPGAVGITGITALSFTARTSGVASYYTITPPADTGITTATESIGENHVTATRTWVDGTVALQRERFFAGPTYNKTTTSATFTDVFNMYLTPPIAGTGVTFTRGHTLGILDATSAASSITGGFIVATALGTAATSVGIGGGIVNAGTSVNVQATTNQLVLGTTPNFTTVSFPASSGAVTVTMPNVTSTVATVAATVPLVSNVYTYQGGGVQSITETSEAATCNWANGSTCVIAGEANTTAWTLTMSNPVSGQVYRIYVTQQTSGPVPLPTFSPTVTWVNGAPTFSGTNTKHDAIACQYVGTTYFCGLIGNNF
jgi:hypothetical protein